MRITATTGKLALLLCSCVVAVALAEITARVFHGFIPERAGHHKLLCEPDPLLGWRKVAGAVRRHTTSEYDVEERINSKGLRGPELDYEKPAGAFRVLVLGDSFTEGYTVEEDEVFTEVLRERLSGASDRAVIQVVNGGTGGYSTDQELLFFRSEGRKYAPDLVILMVVENDVWFNAQAEYPRAPKPLFELRGDELVLTNTPVPEASEDGAAMAPRPATRANRLKAAFNERLALYGFVRDGVKNRRWLYSAAIKLGLADAPGDDAGGPEMPDEWLVFKREPPAAVRHAWKITEALLLALREEVEREGARLLVVVPPSFDVYPAHWSAIRRKYGLTTEEWSPSMVSTRVAQICARRGIEFLDLTATFREAIADGQDRREPLYFPIDGHWTASGHRLVGETLAAHVAARFGTTP